MPIYNKRFRLKKSFWRQFISYLISISFIANSFLPYTLVGLAYADESSPSATIQTSDSIPSPEPTPEPTPEITPEATPSATPEPTLEITPTATPSATPEPTPEATSSATPIVESTSLSEAKIPLREAGNLLKEFKKETKKNYVEGEVIVKFKKNKLDVKSLMGKAQAFVFEKKFSLEKRDEIKASNIQVFKSKKSTEEMVKELKTDSNVEYAEPNYLRSPSTIGTNDTLKDKLWGLDNTGQTVEGTYSVHTGTADKDIDAPEAWGISEGNGTIVAIIDSGVAYNHPDLVNSMWDGSMCKDENGGALGGCNAGYDYEDGDKIPLPTTSSHGTHIAGTIAAEMNNGKGIIGVAPETKIMALKFGLDTFSEAKAIDFAIQNGAKVISASFGGGTYSQSEYDAINRFKSAGGIFVAAAGNNSTNNDSAHIYPSDYTLDNIISVAGTDQNDEIYSYSNYGTTSVDVGAPGTNIYSTVADSNSFSEDFEGSSYNIEFGGSTSSRWSIGNDGSSKVAYSDKSIPYQANVWTWLIAKSTIDLSNSNIKGATLDFTIWCDTPSSATFEDYIATDHYSNGSWNWSTLYNEDQIKYDGGLPWTDSGHVGYYKNYSEDISDHLSNDFSFSFHWFTNSSVDNNFGCTIDDIKITKYSDGSDEQYGYMNGTSMAAPHVAGLAALIEGYNSGLTPAQVKDIILNSGDTATNLVGKTVSGKRINAKKALDAAAPALSTIATVTSNTYTVGATTITNVPFDTSKATFEAALTKGESHQIWTDTGVHDPVVTGDVLVVTAQDGSTQVTYVITVNPDYATIFGGIKTTLLGQGITTNINTCASTPTGCTGLYFEKTNYGRVTFSASLNLTESNTNTFLQTLGTKMDASNGSLSFDAQTATQLKNAGAEIKMYGFSHGGDTDPITQTELVIKNDSGVVIDPSDGTNYPSITGFTWATASGTVTFSASHFTQFFLNDTIKPFIVSFSVPSTATSLTVSGITVTAHDNRGIAGLMFSESSTPPNKNDIMWSSGTPSTYTFASAGTKTLYAWAKDDAGNVSNVYDGKQVTITLAPPPNNAPSFDSIANQTVNEDSSSQNILITSVSAGSGEDGQTVTVSATSSDTNIIPNPTVSGGGDARTLTYTPAANANGTATITVLANDGQASNNTYSGSFNITVNAVNDTPSFTKGSDQIITEDAGAQTAASWATSISKGPSDESNQTLAFSVTNNNNALFSAQPGISVIQTDMQNSLRYTPAANAYGSATVTVVLNDQGGASSAAQTFTITVNPVNDTPSFTKGNDQNVSEDAGAQTVASWATSISRGPANESGQTPDFIVTNNNNSLFSTQPAVAANGTLTYTPADNANGSATVTVSIHDDGGTTNGGNDTSATQTFVTTVNPVNDAPTITLTSPNGGEVWAGGSNHAITWSASDVDAGQTLLVNLDYTTDGGSVYTNIVEELSNSGTYSWTVPAIDSSTVKIRALVMDDMGPLLMTGSDLSDANFTIDSSSPGITYNYPSAGGQTIWYTSDPGNVIDIDFIWGGGSPLNNAHRKIGAGSFTSIFTADQSSNYTTNWGFPTWSSLSEGLNEISLKVTDTVGNERVESYVAGISGFLFRKDTGAPTTTDSGIDANWHNNDVTVTLNCLDTVSGCATTYHTTDGTIPTASSSTTNPFTLTTDGTYTIKYFSKDIADNGETVRTAEATVKIDKTKPEDVTVSDSGSLTNNPHLVFTWPASNDSGSGISYYNFYLNTAESYTTPIPLINGVNIGNVTTYTLSDSQAALLSSGTTYYAKVRAVDNVGLSQGSGGNWSNGITLDTIAPTVNITSPVSGDTVNETKIITFTDNKNTAPQCSIDNSIFVACTSGLTTLHDISGFDALPDGNFTLYLKDTDSATNTGTVNQANIVKDTTSPELSPVSISSNNTTTTLAKVGDTVTLHFFSSEPIKPPAVYIAGHQISEADITNNVSGGNGNEWFAHYQMASGDSEGQVIFSINYVDAVDNAGPTVTGTTDTSYITFDKTKPVIASHENIAVTATSEAGAVVTYIPPSATDKFDATVEATCTPTSGSTFPIAVTTVNCTKTDAAGNIATPTSFTVTVTANQPPSFDAIADKSVNEDTSSQEIQITGVSAGSGEDGQTVTMSATSSNTSLIPNPTVTGVGATRTLTYTAVANAYGTATITVTANDGQTLNNTFSSTFTITVNSVNDAPVATDDTTSVNEDTILNIAKSTLLANDTDVEANTLSITAVSNSVHGSVVIDGDNVKFTPTANYNGSASFDYTVSDGSLTDTGTVAITINPINDAPVLNTIGNKNIDEFGTLNFTLSASDIDSQNLQFTTSSLSANASFDSVNNIFTFTPNESQGGQNYQVTFTVSDGTLINEEIITISVNEVNNSPVAVNDTASINEDGVLTTNTSTLLANDYDLDTNTNTGLTITAVNTEVNGTVSLSGTAVTFTPNSNFNGTASFKYIVSDGSLTAIGTVSITVNPVNDAPILNSVGNKSVDEFSTLSLTTDATDIDSAELTYSVGVLPANASFDPSTKIFTFTPNEAQGGNTYNVTFTVSDGTLTDEETIAITVNEVNNAPIAQNDEFTTNEDTAISINTSDLLVNDSDPDNTLDQLIVSAISNPTYGTVSILGSQITFTPESNYFGSASFDYTVSDGSLTDTGTVAITVNPINDTPVVDNQTVTIEEDTSVTINLVGTDVDEDSLTYSIVSGVSHGTLGTISSNTVTYTPNANYNGIDSFTYKVNDGSADSNTATVNITVTTINDTPVLDYIGNKTVNELTNLTFTAHATDPDNTVAYSLTNESTGATIDSETGVFSFTPTEAQGPSTYSVTISVSDGTVADSETITIAVNEVNVAPVVNDISTSTNEDTAKTITLTATDSDLPTQTLTYSKVSDPSHGSLSISGNQATYTPAVNYNGADSFTYKASDGDVDSNTATVNITVTAVNDAPILNSIGNKTVNEQTNLTFTATATDPDNTLSYSLVTAPTGATIDSSTGVFSFTPTETQGPNTYTVTVRVTDGTSTDSETITITVNEVNIAPVTDDISTSTDEDTAKTITLTATDSDFPENTITYSIVSGVSHGILSVISGNTVTYTPNANYNGIDSFTYKTNDGSTDSNVATVTINVNSVNDAPVAVNNATTTEKNTLLTLSSSSVLSNDSDIENDSLSITSVGNPSHGTVTFDGSNISFTPELDFAGEASFEYSISDGNGGTDIGTVNVIVLSDTQTVPETAKDGSGDATLNNDTPEVVISDPDQPVDVAIDSGTTDPIINVSSFVDGGTGDIPQITITSDDADVSIPATTVTGPNDWNGVISAPTVTTLDLPVISGETLTLSTAIEIGFATDKLSFDNAVRILLPNQAGKRAGYSRPGTDFTEITNICAADTQETGDALVADGECKIDAGLDLVIWTKHFTKFAAYTQTTNNNEGNGGGGSGVSDGKSPTPSAPVCNDTKPRSAPVLLSAVAGTNTVTLTWSAASTPVTYYLVTYGTGAGLQQYGNPNVGGAGTTSYTITGLSGGNTYYFRVRAGNGCAPGDYSNELSATIGGGFIAGPATGFEEGVLGASTDATPTVTPTPTPLVTENTPGVLGSTTEENKINYWWWLLLLIPLYFGGRLVLKKK